MVDSFEMKAPKRRAISWLKAARKGFDEFPAQAQIRILTALEIASNGRKADIAKPMTGFGSAIFEIALQYQRNAYRTIYGLDLDRDIWVIHAFKKKSKKGIRTPKQEIETIRFRIIALKEMSKDEETE